MRSFITLPLDQAHSLDLAHNPFPCTVNCFVERAELDSDHTHYGYIFADQSTLSTPHGSFQLNAGMYFAIPGQCRVQGGRGIIVSRHDYQGFFHIGGPVEEEGRLRYIDGCTDSLLIPPPLIGDPCLNLLCFPPGIHQTMHTHPSFRFGVVASGRGICHTEDGAVPLLPGYAFFIDDETKHCFETQDESMRVIAFHPDSDFGPDHDNHPMINRTVVDGTSARYLDHIRTLPSESREETHEVPQV